MTIVELFIFCAVATGIYFLLKPIQKRLERFLLKFFQAKKKHGAVIDITDYKKDKKDE